MSHLDNVGAMDVSPLGSRGTLHRHHTFALDVASVGGHATATGV